MLSDQELDRRNQNASDPNASVWVSANAGSGKTHLLVDRVIRLLLEGTPPERILCLTFTKAAASEMTERLFQRLSQWIAMPEADLAVAIGKITGDAKLDQSRARRLFAEALETPGGLKIQTIHAFCERLLQRFPLEAGVVPGFSVLDEQAADELLTQIRAEIMQDEAYADIIADIVGRSSADDFDDLLNELLNAKADLDALQDGDLLKLRLSRAFGLARPDITEAEIMQQWCDGLDQNMWRDVTRALLGGKKTDIAAGELTETIALVQNAQIAFHSANDFFLTGTGTRRAKFATKHIMDAHPHFAKFFEAEFERFEKADEAIAAILSLRAGFAALTLAKAILNRFAAEKRKQGQYGYDDLIERASYLLQSAQSAWVLYKLDGGLDHVLIDEAQDTSPSQWNVIAKLTEEFFSGAGARPDVTRSIFVVGDEKQSIYSFQGADPAEFAHMRENFKRATQNHLREVPLDISFRSTKPILTAVDAVWGAYDRFAEKHYAKRDEDHGLVELWEVYHKEKQEPRDLWQAPQAITVQDREKSILARRIASTIRHWLDSGEMLTAKARPIRPDDILILLRNRGSGKTGFMDRIVASLKQQNLPVAGADRLRLSGHIAVMDLLALARFVLNAEDDLSLACILKSPLLKAPFDEEALLEKAAGRGNQSLYAQMQDSPQMQSLQAWLSMAALSPYEFFSKVLLEDKAYGRFIARLGQEASEPLDAFMAKCLDYERDHAPSLGGFLSWMEEGASEIKRDADQGNGEIRVMTVHAAKGLEANIVILPDTTTVPDGKQAAKIYFHEDEFGRLPIWRFPACYRANLVGELFRAADQARHEEHARLLYVAMTRASDRLYITGATDLKETVKEGSWYDRCEKSLKPIMQEMVDFAGRKIWRLENQQKAIASDKSRDITRIKPLPPPQWADENPPAEIGTRWLSPSRIGREEEEPRLNPAGAQSENRFRRGQIIHTLLQYLPDLAQTERASAMARYLARPGLRLAREEAEIIAKEVMGLLQHPEFADVFSDQSLAEVPLAALLGDGKALSGRIDRLVILPDQVLIVDYKTNRPPPKDLAKVPRQYVQQMAAYRAALGPLFPDKTIRTGLIWTVDARFMELSSAQLDGALLDQSHAAS